MASNTTARDYDLGRMLDDYRRRIEYLERRLAALFGGATPESVATQGARVTRNAVQSISNNSFTTINFNAEVFDNNAMHDNATNNSRITINVSGIYDIGFYGEFESGAYQRTMYRIIINGATVIAIEQQTGTAQSIPQRYGVAAVYPLVAGDYVEIEAFQQNTGLAARDLVNVNGSPSFWAVRVGG